jgi:hypothetical protein
MKQLGKMPMDNFFYKTLSEESYKFCVNNIETIANNKVKLVSIIEMSILETEKKLNVKFPGLFSQVLVNQKINFKTESVIQIRCEYSDSNFLLNTDVDSKRKDKSNIGSIIIEKQISDPSFRVRECQSADKNSTSTFKKIPIPNVVPKSKVQKNSPFKVVGSSIVSTKKEAKSVDKVEKSEKDDYKAFVKTADSSNSQNVNKGVSYVTHINNQYNYNFPNLAVNPNDNKEEIKNDVTVKHIDNPCEESDKKQV